MKKLLLLSILFIVGCEEMGFPIDDALDTEYSLIEDNTIIRFNNYNDFSSINSTDIFGNPLGIIGEGITGGCSQDSLFGLTDSICGCNQTLIDFGLSDSLILLDSLNCNQNTFIDTITYGRPPAIDTLIVSIDPCRGIDSILYSNNNNSNLIIVTPSDSSLFTFTGDFDIIDIIVNNDSSIIIIPNYNSFYTYPNPFVTTITFDISLTEKGLVELYIVDENYNIIETIQDDIMEQGSYSLNWDATNIPTGYYRSIINYNGNQCFSNLQKQ